MTVLKLNKGLPFHNEAEQCVLGAIFINPAFAIPHTLGYLIKEDFYNDIHRNIFEAMQKIHRSGGVIDVVTVFDLIPDDKLAAIGGALYLGYIADSTPTAANVKYYARILRRETERREKIIKAADDIEKAYAENAMPSKGFVRMAEVLEDVLADAYAATTEGRYAGYASGFDNLDEYLGGFKPGELYIIAGRPSQGKSALCAQMADNIFGMGGRVAFFPLEVGKQGLARNIAAMHTETEVWKLRHGKGGHQSDGEQTALLAYLELQRGGVFNISGNKTARGVETVLREMISEHGGLDVVVIDHLQEMAPDKQSWGGKRHYEIETTLVELRRMARELNIPIILAAQVGRSAEGREPTLSEIKDSGSVEQIADCVLIIHGEARGTGLRTIHVAKHRNGATGRVSLYLQGEILKFRSESS